MFLAFPIPKTMPSFHFIILYRTKVRSVPYPFQYSMAKAGLCSTPITIPHYGGRGGGWGLESGNHVVRPSLGHVVRTSLGRR